MLTACFTFPSLHVQYESSQQVKCYHIHIITSMSHWNLATQVSVYRNALVPHRGTIAFRVFQRLRFPGLCQRCTIPFLVFVFYWEKKEPILKSLSLCKGERILLFLCIPGIKMFSLLLLFLWGKCIFLLLF